MRFTVEYDPMITQHAERLIKFEITPSMVSTDETSSQFPIDICIDSLQEDNTDGVFDTDIKTLKELVNEGVAYIEI